MKVDQAPQTESLSVWNAFLDKFPQQKYKDLKKQKEIARQESEARRKIIAQEQEQKQKTAVICATVQKAAKKMDLEQKTNEIKFDKYSYPEVDENVVGALFKAFWQKGKKIGSGIAKYAAAHDSE